MSERPWQSVLQHDEEIYNLIEKEFERQAEGLELIASENFTSPAVMAAMSSVLTNKYAEGLPGKRYYGGCEIVDQVESIAINRLKHLFGSKFANVQPHSGAQANAAVFLSLCKPGDKILGMSLSHGGHLTHGSPVNFSGLTYEAHSYILHETTERLDYDAIEAQALKLRPRLLIAGASAYSRVIDFKRFREIADKCGALLLVDMAHIAGLVAAGVHPSPVSHAHVVTSTTHKTLRGPRGGVIMWNDESLKFDKAVFPGIQGGPLEHVIAAKAICFREAAEPSFKDYQTRVVSNAQTLANALVQKGFRLVSGGTDNHLLLLDLSGREISGKDLEEALGKVAITVNKNTVPNEKRSPFVTSGVRIGTPAVTTRGFGKSEMIKIADWVGRVCDSYRDPESLAKIRVEVQNLANSFPLYAEWSRH